MYYYTLVICKGLKSKTDFKPITIISTIPLSIRGLKRFPIFHCGCNNLTTPLNNRGLKPQDIVYFAVSEGGTPQVIPRSCENARKNTGKRRKPTPKIQRQAVTTCLSGQQKTKPIPRIAMRPEQAWFLCLLKK